MKQQLLLTAVTVISACAQAPAPRLACNLKAFTTEERADWRKRSENVMASASAVKELSDGYSFAVAPGKASLVDLARWVELERKCCPFFSFEIGMRGEDGSLCLNLRGGRGVKAFIAQDLRVLFERLGRH